MPRHFRIAPEYRGVPNWEICFSPVVRWARQRELIGAAWRDKRHPLRRFDSLHAFIDPANRPLLEELHLAGFGGRDFLLLRLANSATMTKADILLWRRLAPVGIGVLLGGAAAGVAAVERASPLLVGLCLGLGLALHLGVVTLPIMHTAAYTRTAKLLAIFTDERVVIYDDYRLNRALLWLTTPFALVPVVFFASFFLLPWGAERAMEIASVAALMCGLVSYSFSRTIQDSCRLIASRGLRGELNLLRRAYADFLDADEPTTYAKILRFLPRRG